MDCLCERLCERKYSWRIDFDRPAVGSRDNWITAYIYRRGILIDLLSHRDTNSFLSHRIFFNRLMHYATIFITRCRVLSKRRVVIEQINYADYPDFIVYNCSNNNPWIIIIICIINSFRMQKTFNEPINRANSMKPHLVHNALHPTNTYEHILTEPRLSWKQFKKQVKVPRKNAEILLGRWHVYKLRPNNFDFNLDRATKGERELLLALETSVFIGCSWRALWWYWPFRCSLVVHGVT